MYKFCVVAKNKETFFIKRLIEEVGESGVALFDPWSDFLLPEAQLYLARTSGVYRSELDLLILKSLPPEKLINPVKVLERFRTKSRQFIWFEQEDIPVLPWLSLNETDTLDMARFFRLYPECLVKPDRGQGGWGIETFHWEGFSRWWKRKVREGDRDYLLQPFIKDAPEYRYFFMEDELPVILRREKTSEIAANFKAQGKAHVATLPPEILEPLEDVVRKSEAHYGAIDFFLTDRGITILELNTVPGIEQLEKVSGINIAAKFLRKADKLA